MPANVEANIHENGTLEFIRFANHEKVWNIDFRNDEFNGPAWYGVWNHTNHTVQVKQSLHAKYHFEAQQDGIMFGLTYRFESHHLVITANISNRSGKDFTPQKVGLRWGINTYMEHYPAWNDLYFPTLLRCEKTHFWGYLMTPLGDILGIASPDPIASWSMNYNQINDEHLGHRIYTCNLDLMHELPLPERHPHNLVILKDGEDQSWEIHLVPIEELSQVQKKLEQICLVPMISLEKYTLLPGEKVTCKMMSSSASTIKVSSPSGYTQEFYTNQQHDAEYIFHIHPTEEFGVHTINLLTANGKVAEATFYVRKNWSWYLRQARKEALEKPQKATTHLEAWYGFFSAFLARKYFPDTELDQKAEKQFTRCLELMFDIVKGEPISDPGRVQNTATAISLLTDAFEATQNISYIEIASKLADFLLKHQAEDGSYRTFNRGKNNDGSELEVNGENFTSVLYMAKSMLELSIAEENLAKQSEVWSERYSRHFQSASSAIENLELLRDNISTEGQPTFEDGMVSCTALQLGMFALLQADATERERFQHAAQFVLNKHRCLEQVIIPDCRMHGATLRFWEAQYDVLIKNNMLSSPHGWTSWKIYASWYLYLLTGIEHYLRQTMDTLGTCMQVMDIQTGKLRWAFVCDPYIEAEIWEEDQMRRGHGVKNKKIIGEQYIEMVSGWWKAPENQLVGAYPGMRLITRDGELACDNQGGSCDNDVHEHFKCLEEVGLTSAYVVERSTGEWISWNCRIDWNGAVLSVFPQEDIIHSIHVNLQKIHQIEVHFHHQKKVTANCQGMMWIRN